jgi:hypothetical protein
VFRDLTDSKSVFNRIALGYRTFQHPTTIKTQKLLLLCGRDSLFSRCRDNTGLSPRLWLWLIVLQLVASNCLGTSVSFVGSGFYNILGNTVVLSANEILNNDIGSISGTLRLELWAFSAPYPQATVGYKLASDVLGQLNGGFDFFAINSGSIPFLTPPPGTWYFSLQAREYVGTGSDGYATRAWINFSSPVRVAGGANFGDVLIVGSTSWQVVGSSVNLVVPQVANICNLGVSGSLRLDLWATASPYGGGTITGYRFGSVPLNPLTGGYNYNNINQTVPFISPPDGVYYVTLTLSEYSSGIYTTDSYVTYATPLAVGSAPPAPVANAATSVTSSMFIANWSSVAGATGYRLDVSPSSTFSTYVGGYQDLDVGNVTSSVISGLSAGTVYYYRVRAYNGVGISRNSATISVIITPPAPTANAATGVTTNAFTANWNNAIGSSGYRLDISITPDFSSYVTGYQGLDVANVVSRSVSGLSPNTTYYYRVRAYNGGGTSGSSDTVTVTTSPAPSSPQITSQPLSQTATVGDTVTFTVGASGALPLHYQWWFNGASVPSATGSSLTLANVQLSSAGNYEVSVTNPLGPTNSSVVSLAVNPRPKVALTISLNGSNIRLAWPVSGATGFLLQESSTPGNWVDSSATVVIQGNENVAVIAVTGGMPMFYRLSK